MVYGRGLCDALAIASCGSVNLDSGISPILVLAVMKVMVDTGRRREAIGSGLECRGIFGGRGGASYGPTC
jgi:hypothetical protein